MDRTNIDRRLQSEDSFLENSYVVDSSHPPLTGDQLRERRLRELKREGNESEQASS